MSVTLYTTRGNIKLELECTHSRLASYNFLALCASGAYDGTTFHRLVPGFILQGGSTTTNGGSSIWGKTFPDELSNNLKFDQEGVLATATSGPNTGGSQFFISLAPCRQLNNSCTIFGKVIDGWATIQSIEQSGADANEEPIIPVIIERVEIHANPFADADMIIELE